MRTVLLDNVFLYAWVTIGSLLLLRVYVGNAGNEDEDGVREFPQSCLWPHSVFTQLLFCVSASVLHTHPPKEVASVTGTQQDIVKYSTLKSNRIAEGQLTVLFLLLFYITLSHNFVLSWK